MTERKLYSRVNIFIAIIALALLLPSVIKFSHIFEQHEHVVCLGENQSHLHEIDLDCEFFKFKLNNNFLLDIDVIELTSVVVPQNLSQQYYTFIKGHQQSTAYLRGPPSLVLIS